MGIISRKLVDDLKLEKNHIRNVKKISNHEWTNNHSIDFEGESVTD